MKKVGVCAASSEFDNCKIEYFGGVMCVCIEAGPLRDEPLNLAICDSLQLQYPIPLCLSPG